MYTLIYIHIYTYVYIAYIYTYKHAYVDTVYGCFRKAVLLGVLKKQWDYSLSISGSLMFGILPYALHRGMIGSVDLTPAGSSLTACHDFSTL